MVDLLAIAPTYLGLVLAGTQSLLVIRTLRLLRVFRVFKLAYYLSEARVLLTAVRTSQAKLVVFPGLGAVDRGGDGDAAVSDRRRSQRVH